MAHPSCADRRVDDREQRLVVAGNVVRAGVDLERNPRVDLAIPGEDAVRADQARRVEDDAGPARIDLDHRSRSGCRCRARAPWPRSRSVCSFGIGTASCSSSYSTRRVDRSGMRELGEHHEPHRQERLAADHGRVDHRRSCDRCSPRISSRVRGLGKSVWHAAAAYRRRELVIVLRLRQRAAGCGRRPACSSVRRNRRDAPRVRIAARARRRVARHAMRRQRPRLVRARGVDVHLLAVADRRAAGTCVSSRPAAPAARSRRRRATPRRLAATTTNWSSTRCRSAPTSPSRV